MDAKHRLHILLCAAAAGGLSALLVLADFSRLNATQSEESLRWARQTVSQVETLTLSARERKETDPLQWAMSQLSQGVEPRAIKIFKSDDRAPGQSGENYSFDRKTGTFEYLKPFPPEGDTVLHVQYIRGYRGFLNTSSPFANDAAVVGVFFVLFFLGIGLSRGLGNSRNTAGLRIEVIDWAASAKAVLIELGLSIKNTVEGAQAITTFSSKAFEALRTLRGRIHGGLRSIHDARRALQQNREIAKRLETIALSLMAETRKLGVTEGSALATLSREIHTTATEVGEQSRKTSTCIEKLEIELEPWSVDADVAFHAFDGIANAVAGMNNGIRGVKSSVIENARRIGELRDEMLETKTVTNRESARS